MDDIIEPILLVTLIFCPFGLLALIGGMGTLVAVRHRHGVRAALSFLPIQTLFVFLFFVPEWDTTSTVPYPCFPVYCLCLAIVAAYLAVCVCFSYAIMRCGKKKTYIGASGMAVFLILLMVALGYYFRKMS